MSSNIRHANKEGVDANRIDSWSEAKHLKELHVERGLSACDISRVHNVDAKEVRERLKEIGIFQGRTHAPKFGMARKLWERGLQSGENE